MKITRSLTITVLKVAALVLILSISNTNPIKASEPNQQDGEIHIGEKDNKSTVEINEFQILSIELRSQPSTGYFWQIADIEQQLIQATGRRFVPDREVPGSPGYEVLQFQPITKGTSTLTLFYGRPWAGNNPTQEFTIQVNAQGQFNQPKTSSLPVEKKEAITQTQSSETPPAPELATSALPTSFNWCDQGGCSAIKDQGGCGSCWAFATVGPLESKILLEDKIERDISEQYLVSCNADGWGCNGGWWAHDYHWWKTPAGELDAGAVYERDFSYVAQDVPCSPPHPHYEKLDSWAYVAGENGAYPTTDAIKQAIYDHGPVSVALCVGPGFAGYTGGVFGTDETSYCNGGINHAVVLTGWNDAESYWYLRNSWGANWGESGYMRILYGTSRVGFNASYIDYGKVNPLFSDGFELGNLSAWSSSTTDSGDLSVAAEAKHAGNYGMKALLDDNVSIYVTSDHPNAETHYQAQFNFDPNSISMVSGDTHLIFGGYTGTSTAVLRVQFRRYSGNYQVQASLLNDGSTWKATSWYTISDSYHKINVDWKAATAAGANNGALTFWVDDDPLPELTGVDNDTRRIDRIRLGAVNGIDSGTRGTTYFDAFESSKSGGGSASFVLTVYKTGTGNGIITSQPTGIDCGSDCSESYTVGTLVTLTAAADPGFSFTGWSGGGCFGTDPCTITITADTTVSAAFEDTTPPSLSWISPVTDGQVYDVENEMIQFEVNASDNIGISEVVFSRWDYVNSTSVEIGRVHSAPYRISFDTSTLLPEWNEIDAVAYDTAGFATGSYIWLNHINLSNIFKDGFESGNLSSWSSCTVDGGDLSVKSAAKYAGNYGMQAAIDDNVAIYCTSDQPNAEIHYLASFYFHPNSITMTGGDTHLIFGGYSGTSTLVLRVQFRKYAGAYQVQASLLNDASTWKATSWYTINNAYHQISMDWRAATGVVDNNGGLTFWVDGNPLPELTGVDNDTRRIDRARLGAVNGIDTGTRGVTYFDEFESSEGEALPVATFNLTINKAGTGSGTVSSDPAGIDCGLDCSESYTSGTLVTLTATAASGSKFSGWSGESCSGSGACTVTMSADTTVTATFDTIAPDDLIFADGFESGNLSAWTANTNDAGDLSASAIARLVGSWGMQAVIDDANPLFVRDDTPNAEPRYRSRFYFDPNSIPMTAGDAHFIFKGFSGTSSSYVEIFRVELHRISTGYEVRASLVGDGTTWVSTAWVALQDKSSAIELDWRASTAAGANNGGLTLWIDGVQPAATSSVDNDTRRIDFVRLGALTGIDTGTRGTYFFDQFESRKQNYIGP